MKMTTAQIVKGSKVSRFVKYRNGTFWYVTDSGFEFIIQAQEMAGVTLLAEDKTIFFMRWIRKWNETPEFTKPLAEVSGDFIAARVGQI